jgi:hypothetical protein
VDAKPELLDRVRERIRGKHYSYRTEQQYVAWIRRFILFNDKRHPRRCRGRRSLAISPILRSSAKGKTLSAPRADAKTHYIAIGLDPDLDSAMQMAYDETVEELAELKGMDPLLITPLASIAIDYRITQIVDGAKVVHAMIP